jgi:hypothetical protein
MSVPVDTCRGVKLFYPWDDAHQNKHRTDLCPCRSLNTSPKPSQIDLLISLHQQSSPATLPLTESCRGYPAYFAFFSQQLRYHQYFSERSESSPAPVPTAIISELPHQPLHHHSSQNLNLKSQIFLPILPPQTSKRHPPTYIFDPTQPHTLTKSKPNSPATHPQNLTKATQAGTLEILPIPLRNSAIYILRMFASLREALKPP